MTTDYMPVLHVRGSHHDVGFRMGSTFRNQIQDALASTDRNFLHRFYSSKYGHDIVQTFLDTTNSVYPQYVEEMKGIASGANVEFMEVFLTHLEAEISTLTEKLFDFNEKTVSSGCSDLFLNTSEVAANVHSEDVSPDTKDKGYIVHAEVIPSAGGEVTQTFTYYTNPGCLSGNSFGLQPNGLCQSLNVVFQKKINTQGIPRRLVNRAMCVASDIDEATEIAKTVPGPASGFNVNYTQTSEDYFHMCNLEVAGELGKTILNRRDITGFEYHFNEYQFLTTPQIMEPSSSWRRTKLAELTMDGSPRNVDDLLDIIGDPDQFYRDGTPPDYWATSAVALFDHDEQLLRVFGSNPRQSDPILTLPFLM